MDIDAMMCLYPLPRFSYLVPSRQVCFSSEAARATNNERTIFDRTFLAYRWSSLDLLFRERTRRNDAEIFETLLKSLVKQATHSAFITCRIVLINYRFINILFDITRVRSVSRNFYKKYFTSIKYLFYRCKILKYS